MTSRRALWGLIVVSGMLRLGWAASLGPGNDEAYHYLFAVHPDLSYFDHPPMLAIVEALGIALAGGNVNVLSLRLGFVLLFAGSTWLVFRLTSRYYGERAGFLAAFALNVSAYHTAAAGAFALPDGPLLFFWLLTLDRLTIALGLSSIEDTKAIRRLVSSHSIREGEAPAEPPSKFGSAGASPSRDKPPASSRDRSYNSIRPWIGVGLAWGCGMLSKYHAIFLPAGVLLYIAMEPKARGWLRRPGPYVAAAVGILVFSPVIIWNASHGWVSFLFQAGRAVGESRFRPETLLGAIFLPALYLFPWLWVQLVGLLFGGSRRVLRGSATAADKFLLTQALLPMATFLAVACKRAVLPHWTLVGFLPLLPMLGEYWSRSFETNPSRFRRRAVVLALFPVLAAIGVLFQAKTGFFQKGRPGGLGVVAASGDPTLDMVGWDEVAEELRKRGLIDNPETFVFTCRWYQSGHLGFSLRESKTPVLCYHAWDARSFAFWSKPEEWVGRDGIFVLVNGLPNEQNQFAKWFQSIEPIGEFDVVRAGAPIRNVRLFRCVRQRFAFPFDDLGTKIQRVPSRAESRIATAIVPEATR